ncbi:PDZ and LIM domain protein Zasp-like isoform X9 [Anopheles darlingi]|uniref:PDZ and LIM domain protein Zasp-like isoform X9 n=1 Tax=Anopheles darlingi TaxID=43151 RepID=UPI0020FFFFF2|nr:PDZ and LIM domain protein Zasp-like isoform X9 [Anopheles darlingi]
MANLTTVRLQRGDGQAWGFRLQGGKDFSAPLVLQRVNGGSVADQAGLMAGDALIKVNGTEVFNMRHKDAQDVIVAAGNSFELTVSRGGATWRPTVTPTGSLPSPSPSLPGNVTPVTRTSLAATPQELKPIGSGHNNAAKPFAAVNGNDGQIKSIVNNQYNTPVGMYSDETIAETLSSQAEVLAGGVLGVNFKKNERVYSPANSEVYKLLHEQGDDPEPDSVYSNNFHYSVNKLESASSHFYATQSHAIGGYATAGRLPVGSLTAPPPRPRGPSPLPPSMQGQLPRPPMMQQPAAVPPKPQPQQPQQQQLPRPVPAPVAQAPAPAPAPAAVQPQGPPSAFRPAPNAAPRAGIPPRVHNEGHKTGVQAISAALNAHANLNGRSQSPYGNNGIGTVGLLGSQTASQSPSHSRSSSTTSSSGYCNSSSLSPVQSTKVSPLHSRTSSENELIDRSTSNSAAVAAAAAAAATIPSFDLSVSFPSPPSPLPPPPPPLLLVPATGYAVMEDASNAFLPPPPPPPPSEAPSNGTGEDATCGGAAMVFGANGLATPVAAGESGSADADTDTVTANDYGFYYQTMGGRVIRSVFPPGKSSNYKVNQNNITPKPFGAPLPVSPLAQVQAPASYPPVAGSVPTPFSAALTGQAPAPAPAPAPVAAPVPAPALAPAPVLAPAFTPASAPAPQDGPDGEPKNGEDPEGATNEEATCDPGEDDGESPVPVFAWPPKPTVADTIPTATPIYVAPPETQRVIIKPITVIPPPPKEKSKTPPDDEGPSGANRPANPGQSKSAPELSRGQQQQQQQQEEQDEELSDSFGMTTTTATTTTATSASSEEYRMYQTQTSQPIVTYYDTPQYELERPFSGSGQRSSAQTFGREIPSQLEDLPVPSGRLSMMEALATAPDRPYTPFSEVRLDGSSEVYQEMLREQPSIPVDPDRQYSAFANVGGNRTPKPFVPIVPEVREPPPLVVVEEEVEQQQQSAPTSQQASVKGSSPPEGAASGSRRSSSSTHHESNTSRRSSVKEEVSVISIPVPPYPKKDGHMGEGHYSLAPRRETASPLNKPAEIPPYQRKWFNLPTQNPPHTPEPEELRTNVPLAFVNTHSTHANLTKPIAKPPSQPQQQQQQQAPVHKPPTPVQGVGRSGPYTTIQNRAIPVVQQPSLELDAELAQYNSAHARLQHKGVIDRGQSFTPSLILTKHSTTIPYYQHQLGFEEYFAEVKQFDGHTTPQPNRTKSPAFGPPPNPLKPHVPPSREGIPVESGLYLSMGKLHGVPWYANKDHVPADIQQKMQQQLHLEANQRFGRSVQHHEQQQQQQVTIQQQQSSSVEISSTTEQQQQQQHHRETSSERAAVQSAQQVGNALIQKRTRFVEEQSSHAARANSITSESSRYSSKIKENEAPQKGFVAQQKRRFSGQDEALNLPPQPTEQELRAAEQQQQIRELLQKAEEEEEEQKRQQAALAAAAPKPPIRHVDPPTPKPAPPPSSFPSTNPFPEEYVDHFPSKSARKASVLFPQRPAAPGGGGAGRTDCPSPSSFKAQFNEFMIGANALGALQPGATMPPVCEIEEKEQQQQQQERRVSATQQPLTQSWPPQLPSAMTAAPVANGAQTNNTAVAVGANNGRAPITKLPSSRSNSNAFLDFLNRPTPNYDPNRSAASAGSNALNKGRAACSTSAPNRGRGVMNKAVGPGGRVPLCGCCNQQIRGPFITALGRIWCPDHFICHNANCKRPLADIGFVEEKGDLYCEYCFEEFLAPLCSKCNGRVKGDCLNAIGKQFHPECFKCTYCGKQFGNSPFFLEEGDPYCEKDWNDLFTTKCFACGFPVEAGDKWVEALNNNYHSQCFNCTSCKKNLEGQSFFAKGGRPFCKNHAR